MGGKSAKKKEKKKKKEKSKLKKENWRKRNSNACQKGFTRATEYVSRHNSN